MHDVPALVDPDDLEASPLMTADRSGVRRIDTSDQLPCTQRTGRLAGKIDDVARQALPASTGYDVDDQVRIRTFDLKIDEPDSLPAVADEPAVTPQIITNQGPPGLRLAVEPEEAD